MRDMKNPFKTEPNPSFPNEWDDANNTLYREFRLHSYEIESLIRLVRKNYSTKGNNGVYRASLLGKLHSLHSVSNWIEITRRKNPKTWKLRLFWKRLTEKYHRTFETKKFKSNVRLCNISRRVMNKILEEESK